MRYLNEPMDQVGLGLLVFCVLALTMVCSVMTKRARRRTCRWRWWCPSASSQPESQVARLDFDIGAFGEDSLAGNFDTLRSLIWTMGVCTTEENYHTLELCSDHKWKMSLRPKEYTQAHSEKSDTVKWRNVMKCDQCDSEVFRWSSLGEHVCRVVQKSWHCVMK